MYMKKDSFRFDPVNNVGHLISSTTLLEIKSVAKDTLINQSGENKALFSPDQYATKTKLNAKSCKAKYSVQIAWIEEK